MYQTYLKYNAKTVSKSTQDCSPLLHYHYVSTLLTMQIPTETLSQSHQLCFIGKERDSETGFSYFGARYYDSDLMTGWLSVDPMADKYPGLSPYAYCAWNPVKLVDPDGKEIWIVIDKYNNERVKWTAGKLYNEDNSEYSGNDDFALQTAAALNELYSNDVSKNIISKFEGNSEYDMEIYEGNMNYYSNATGGTEEYGMGLRKVQSIKFNPYLGLAEKGKKETLAPFIALFHEFAHASNAVDSLKAVQSREKDTINSKPYSNMEEKYTIENFEHTLARKYGMLERSTNIIGGKSPLIIIHTSGSLSSK